MNINIILQQAFNNRYNTSLLGDKIKYLTNVAIKVRDLNLDGDVVECGVYKGGSARLLATVFAHKNILLFDSFCGMVEDDILLFGHKNGDFSDTSIDIVKSYLSDKPNCIFYPGWLPSSTNFLKQEKFCFVHLDLDLYQSTKSSIEIFWPRIVSGGVMIFDDWEWERCPGVKKSIIEYFDNNNIKHLKEINGNMCSIFKL